MQAQFCTWQFVDVRKRSISYTNRMSYTEGTDEKKPALGGHITKILMVLENQLIILFIFLVFPCN